ncbi:hypothetical protein Syun_007051 [Stephania yunnanensis]|uniref:Retrovirus-related Pol polyprotein from transposon TNT 1-94-like beta-barrel domain-containing protein n=1 Tax=Stephania yunnanensis TaxID=152371 RepID=A0AAP0L0E7_9MAGN
MCYFRFYPNLSGFNNFASHSSNPTPSPQPPILPSPPSLMTAIVATPNQPSDITWYGDSGATYHITNDLNSLTLCSEYNGSNKIHIGNGAALSIKHIGSTSLKPPSSTIFSLSNLLHVPHITKNYLV